MICAIRSRSCAFWPLRAVLRDSKSFSSPAMAAATVGSLLSARQLLGKLELVGFVAFGQQPGFPRQQFVELRAHGAERRARHRIVEAHHDLVLLRRAGRP